MVELSPERACGPGPALTLLACLDFGVCATEPLPNKESMAQTLTETLSAISNLTKVSSALLRPDGRASGHTTDSAPPPSTQLSRFYRSVFVHPSPVPMHAMLTHFLIWLLVHLRPNWTARTRPARSPTRLQACRLDRPASLPIYSDEAEESHGTILSEWVGLVLLFCHDAHVFPDATARSPPGWKARADMLSRPKGMLGTPQFRR